MKTPNIAQMRFQLKNQPVHLAIGGQGPKNWVKNSIDPVIRPLLQTVRTPDTRLEAVLNNSESTPAMKANAQALLSEFESSSRNSAALNNWIQGNLANYIRKQMAGHDDPIRKLAEQGIVHMPPEQMGYGSSQADMVRQKFGAPKLGQSPEAQAWEDAADVAMNKKVISSLRGHHREPWMDKADPNTEIFHPTDSMHSHYLGFDHIVDVLKQDLADGKIRPEQLNKISMEQAVRRVHQYDQERKKAMAETALKATEGMPVHKEYPEGYKWIEIAPRQIDENQPLPEGYSWKEPKAGVERLQGPERVYLGHTKTEALKAAHQRDRNLVESREKPVRDALKYEGDTMGHCVGGYPDKVMRGESRIFSLRDAKNEPHVTIEVNPKSVQEGIRNLPDAERRALAQEVKNQYFNGVMPGTRDEDRYFDLIDKHYVAKHGMPPPVIRQIKGKQNLKPKPEYIPYIQDFVKSGQWSDVFDKQNADIRDIQKTIPLQNWLKQKNIPHDRYMTEKEYGQHESNYLADQLGLAKGGAVKMADGGQPNLDTMRLALIKNGMYSPLEKAALAVPRTKGTPQEFMSEVSKQPGFRKEELEDRPLNLPEGKMTKADFLKHLMANRGEPLIRTELGGERLDKIRDQMAKELVGEDYEGLNSSEQAEVDAEIKNQYGKMHPKYAEYQLPGGENYREVLLKLPGFSKKDQEKLMSFEASKRRHDPNDIKMHQFLDQEIAKLKDLQAKAGKQYQSSHWDDPNVLAHMRLSDRTGSNGEKLLHLEELQSDWHQEGRKQGYRVGFDRDALKDEMNNMIRERAALVNEFMKYSDANNGEISPEMQDRWNAFKAREEALEQKKRQIENAVPNAPFKKSWHELALKHALHEAATKGYHGIVITPAYEHFNRYGSERIDWQPHPEGGWMVGATEQSGGRHGDQNVEDLARERGILMEKHGQRINTKEDLARIAQDVLSRENSQEHIDKLTKRIWERMQQEPEGTSMPRKEGMEGFYDKILPDYLNKLGKKHGAQVGQVDMRVGSPDETKPLHYFPITDSLRQQIKQEGLPLYKAGGSI